MNNCRKCGRLMATTKLLEEHEGTCKGHRCPECNKGLKTIQGLKTHAKTCKGKDAWRDNLDLTELKVLRRLASSVLGRRTQGRKFVAWWHDEPLIADAETQLAQTGKRIEALSTVTECEKELLATFLVWKRSVDNLLCLVNVDSYIDNFPLIGFSFHVGGSESRFDPSGRGWGYLDKMLRRHTSEIEKVIDERKDWARYPRPLRDYIPDDLAERLPARGWYPDRLALDQLVNEVAEKAIAEREAAA